MYVNTFTPVSEKDSSISEFGQSMFQSKISIEWQIALILIRLILSHLDLHYLQKYLYWSVGMKGFIP